jgi:hypothetical protein
MTTPPPAKPQPAPPAPPAAAKPLALPPDDLADVPPRPEADLHPHLWSGRR